MDQLQSASKNLRTRFGFTLSELLIVIGIVALLAAILFPVFAQARAKEEPHYGCQSNLRHIGAAFDQYLADNDDTYPPALNDIRGMITGSPDPACPVTGCEYYVPTPGTPDPRQTWETSILPYLEHREFLVCPDDPKAGFKGIMRNDRYKGFPVSYSANGYVACYTGTDNYSGCFCRGVMCQFSIGYYTNAYINAPGKNSAHSSINTGIVSSAINHPQATVALTETWSADVDTVDPNGNWTRFGDWNEIGGQSGNEPNYGYRVSCGLPNAGPSNPSTAFAVCGVNGAVSTHHGRYNDLANFLFCDGHVAALSPPTTDPTPDAGNPAFPGGNNAYDPNDQWDATRP